MRNITVEVAARPPAGCSEEWVLVDGRRVRFWHAGAGPAIVLVHGLLGYSFSWRHIIPIFAREYEVFAPDLPGSGFSECDAMLDCRLSSAARRLLGFLDKVGVGSCDLIGSSYGATTAMVAAVVAPSRVRRLVLVSPANPWSKIGRKRLALLHTPLLAWLFPKLARPMRPLHSFFVRRMYGDSRRITPETLHGYALPLLRPGNFEHAAKIVRTWQHDMRELKAMLPKISSVPTLLVWGSKDRVVDPASAEPLCENFQAARIAIMEGAGHLPYEERPEEFSRMVGDFFATAGSKSTTLYGK